MCTITWLPSVMEMMKRFCQVVFSVHICCLNIIYGFQVLTLFVLIATDSSNPYLNLLMNEITMHFYMV